MTDVDLDKQRDAVIEEIKQAFPVKARPRDLINKRFRRKSEGEKILAIFEDKSWIELVNHPDIVYMMSEWDYRGVLTDKSYIYYLPAFLIRSLIFRSQHVLRYGFIQIKNVAPNLEVNQLHVLMAYCSYQAEYERAESLRHNFTEHYDDLLLHLLFVLDEKKPKA